MKRMLVGLTAVLSAAAPTVVANADADHTAPYGDAATDAIADRLDGRDRSPWLATTLDIGGYGGRRHAEIVEIPAGHGKRYVGIIHVPDGKTRKAHDALAGAWFAQKGTKFVVPLRSSTWTDGYPGQRYQRAARWAANRLGGWRLVAP
jgi:hypothetical protein